MEKTNTFMLATDGSEHAKTALDVFYFIKIIYRS